MKSVELTAYCVREYDVKYTVVLHEDDPMLLAWLNDNEMTFDDLAEINFADNRELWDTLMSIPTQEIDIQEDFAPADERFVDFDNFISEN